MIHLSVPYPQLATVNTSIGTIRPGDRLDQRNRMNFRNMLGLLLSLATLAGSAMPARAEELPQRTALDDYINKPDNSYKWNIVSETTTDGMKLVVVDMVSQSWRSAKEVNRTRWQHWVKIAIPDQVRTDTGFLMNGGGSNREGDKPDD